MYCTVEKKSNPCYTQIFSSGERIYANVCAKHWVSLLKMDGEGNTITALICQLQVKLFRCWLFVQQYGELPARLKIFHKLGIIFCLINAVAKEP